MQFRSWFESNTEDVEWLAGHWYKNTPSKEDRALFNEAAINNWVERHADEWLNGQAIKDSLTREVMDPRYEKPIANNLLHTDNNRLKTALGTVTNVLPPDFAFYMGGAEAGNLVIRHPPLAFSEVDRHMLASIIWHELGHAIDWLNPELQNVPVSRPHFKFNWRLYTANIFEARSYPSQIRYLMKRLDGDVDKVEQVLNTAQFPFKMDNRLLKVAKVYLRRFGYNYLESWASKIAAPVLGAASLFGGQQATTAPNTAIVSEDNTAKQVAQLVAKTIDMFTFHKYIIVP